LRKTDQLVTHGVDALVAHVLEAHHLVNGIELQGGSLPRLRGAEPYFACQDAAAERCPSLPRSGLNRLRARPV
jgi:hypothetical protein